MIMGTHGRKGLEQTIFGSVADNVVKKSPTPLLTINPLQDQIISPIQEVIAIVKDIRFPIEKAICNLCVLGKVILGCSWREWGVTEWKKPCYRKIWMETEYAAIFATIGARFMVSIGICGVRENRGGGGGFGRATGDPSAPGRSRLLASSAAGTRPVRSRLCVGSDTLQD